MALLEILVTIRCPHCDGQTINVIPLNAGRGDTLQINVEFPSEHQCGERLGQSVRVLAP